MQHWSMAVRQTNFSGRKHVSEISLELFSAREDEIEVTKCGLYWLMVQTENPNDSLRRIWPALRHRV